MQQTPKDIVPSLPDMLHGVPYHGAGPVIDSVRRAINETPVNSKKLMSAGHMVQILIEEGIPEALASRLYSQVRHPPPLRPLSPLLAKYDPLTSPSRPDAHTRTRPNQSSTQVTVCAVCLPPSSDPEGRVAARGLEGRLLVGSL
jgi:hypothetical protein